MENVLIDDQFRTNHRRNGTYLTLVVNKKITKAILSRLQTCFKSSLCDGSLIAFKHTQSMIVKRGKVSHAKLSVPKVKESATKVVTGNYAIRVDLLHTFSRSFQDVCQRIVVCCHTFLRSRAACSSRESMVEEKKRKRSGEAVTFAEVTPEVGSASSSSSPAPRPLSKRALTAKSVAENRAAHFARADSTTTVTKSAGTLKKTAAGTTPTGFASNAASSQNEQWCGPFTVARTMIAAREAAKKARDDAIANTTAGKVTAVVKEDEYDQHVTAARLRWKPFVGTTNAALKRSQIAPLTDLCVQLLASHFDDMEEETLRYVSPELLHKFAAEMAKRRKFVPEVATKLAVSGAEELSFPECSFLNDETLVTAFAHISEGHGITHEQKLKSLKLINVGHSFTGDTPFSIYHFNAIIEYYPDKVFCNDCFMTDSIATLVSDKYAADLEIMEITGCYRMTESALCILLSKCHDNLRVLDLSCNSRIGDFSSFTSYPLPHIHPYLIKSNHDLAY